MYCMLWQAYLRRHRRKLVIAMYDIRADGIQGFSPWCCGAYIYSSELIALA